MLTGLGGRVAVVRAEATSTKSGILLGARGMRFVDRERALMRLRNVAEMEEWTEEQYLAARSDIGAGYWEDYPQYRGRELANCIVVGVPGDDPRAPDLNVGDGVYCALNEGSFWRGLHKVAPYNTEAEMVTLTDVAERANVTIPRSAQVYFVDPSAILLVTCSASELGEAA